MAIRASEVQFDGEHGYLAQADGDGTAGVLLLTTIYGVNRYIRDYAHMLAEAGYKALIWNYDGGPGIDDIADAKSALARARTLDDGAVARMSKCVGFMRDELKLQSIATLGFCLGGRYCLLLAAADKRIASCVSYHPSIHEHPEAGQTEDAIARAGEIPSPVLLIYPGLDRVTSRATFEQLQASLQQRPSAPTVVHLLPDADHGFLHRPSPANAAAAVFTRPQVLGFLQATLRDRT